MKIYDLWVIQLIVGIPLLLLAVFGVLSYSQFLIIWFAVFVISLFTPIERRE